MSQTCDAKATAPPSYSEAPPRLLGGRLCLDFLNTVSRDHRPAAPAEARVERLTDYRELLYWAQGAAVLAKQDVRDLGYGALAAPEAAAGVLREGIALREALARLFAKPPGRGPDGAESEALVLVNLLLEQAPERRRLMAEGGGYGWRVERIEDDLRRPLWRLLWDAADLLASDRLDRVRACAASDCGWIFLDLTRNRSRRWCSMEDCGNRAKARRHYAKMKKAEG